MILNKLPLGGGGDMVFTTLASGGKNSGTGDYTYTTTEQYEYVIASAHRTGGDPTLTCTKGEQVADFLYSYNGGSNNSGQRVTIWKNVEAGAVITYQSVSNRRGYVFTGVKFQ